MTTIMADWIQRIQTELRIITGDGAAYLPDYMTASVNKEMEFNVSKFEFKGVSGSLVHREEPMGIAYDIEIKFQGANHLDTAQAFYTSARNKNAWNISHPYYGQLLVQPLSLKQNNAENNVSTITGTIIETIGKGDMTPALSAPDTITAQVVQANAALADTYTNNVPFIPANDLNVLSNRLKKIYTAIKDKIEDVQAVADKYTNLYNAANSVLNTAIYDTISIIEQAQEFLLAPAYFADTLQKRMEMFQAAIDIVNNDIVSAGETNSILYPSVKKLYENNAGALITGMCQTSIINITPTDYGNRSQVVAVIQLLISTYNNYLLNLDSIQTLTGGTPTSYIPNPDALFALAVLVRFTVSNLFDIANDAKQQRTYVLPEDSNTIQIANRLYGLLPDDSTIDYLIATNNIVGYELLQLQKGRQLVYYV